MSLNLDVDYEKHLRSAKPVVVGEHTIRPKGALGAASIYPPQIIPPINTSIQFDLLPVYKLSDHPGLAALDTPLPKNFNWRTDGKEKSALMSKPGNQLLCGSCWAISAAGIVADNHVVSGTVDWIPNLSTTWCLAAYPQHQCQGGNPAKLYQDISDNGIATAHCIDYSWCSENASCNGKATAHFEKANANLSDLIPDVGCYDSSIPHYLYYIDPPKSVSLQSSGMDPVTFTNTIKKHIFYNGPVQGGFLVFKNFRTGAFSKLNGGVYLETCNYDSGDIKFDETQTDPLNYIGSHAIAIIGWGIQKDVIIDNFGTKKDIPYWYCRNSWGEKWADEGYFKMPMYPHNKLSQFDSVVQIKTPKGTFPGGGIVMLTASKPPILKTLEQLNQKFSEMKKSNPPEYYSEEKKVRGEPEKTKKPDPKTKTKKPEPKPKKPDSKPDPDSDPDSKPDSEPDPDQESTSSIWKYIRIILFVFFCICMIVLLFFAIKYLYKQINKPVAELQTPVTTLPNQQIVKSTQPIVTPTQPIVTPNQPIATPTQPLVTPNQPVVTPVATPNQPVVTPVATPTQPVATPNQPVITPVATPTQPIVTPNQPVVTPVATPNQPVATQPVAPNIATSLSNPPLVIPVKMKPYLPKQDSKTRKFIFEISG